MTIQSKSNIRRFFSLSAFTALIAAVTMAFAEAPKERTQLDFDRAQPALSVVPNHSVRVAEAPMSKRAVPAKAKSAAQIATSGLSGTLNLNTASVGDLMKLPGIGPKKAERIVNWRGQHGKFNRVVDLRRVKGFGSKTIKKLKPYLSVKGDNTLE
jgi:comEA protein